MYPIAICDDNEMTVQQLKNIITNWRNDIDVECFNSGEELLAEYKSYSVIFLDIEMKNMNGIEAGKRIRNKDKNVKIIYLTSYQDYIAGAFGVHAFQYLLKPFNKEMIEQQLDEAFSYMEHKYKTVILEFKTTKGIICQNVENILYFEYSCRKISVITTNCTFFIKDKISNIEKQMKQYGFNMPHQSFVVNLFHIRSVMGNEIYLTGNHVIPLAQKKQKSWKRELTSYYSDILQEE